MEKIISCIGDSLTEGDYGVLNMAGIANVQEKGYPYFLKQFSGCVVNNFGHCGFQSTNILDVYEKGLINVANSDIVIIMLGTNGGQTPEGNSENDIAYKRIIDKCRKEAPAARIILCTPPHVTINPKMSGFGFLDNVKNAAIFVKNIAKSQHLEVIDLFNDNHFNDDNEDIMQPNDGLHFSEIGYRTIAEIIYGHIRKYL